MKKILTILLFGFLIVHNAWAEEIKPNLPEIYIKAINPGYTIDGKSNVGEMIELARQNSDTPISLAGATVGYTNSSGNYSVLYEFPEHSWMTGETILLRLASSPDSELANINYAKTIAFKAGISLRLKDDIIDEVCWTSKADCMKEFTSSKPTTLVRNSSTGTWEHLTDYNPDYNESNYNVESVDETVVLPSQCKGLEFSEILSYYESIKSEQFIELRNTNSEQILMSGCKIKYKNKYYPLDGIIKPEAYFTYVPKDFSLTKNPTNSNLLEIIDVNGDVIDKLTYPNGQRKGASYALIGYDKKGEEIWQVTYAPTPNEPNNFQEFKTCDNGKVINRATGNCVKVADVKFTICKAGQYLNPLTGRCKKIESAATKTCKDGYYLNPSTNRCRKIKENTGANYALTPENYEEKSSFIALYAVIGVIIAGLIYLIFEFRHEIVGLFGKVFRRPH